MKSAIVWTVAAALCCPLGAAAQSTTGSAAGDAAVNAGAEVLQREAEKAAGRIFTKEEIRIIKDVLGAAAGVESETDEEDDEDRDARGRGGKGGKKGKSKGLPPGLAKKETLPPGLQMQLERGGSLPPGLAKRDLPPDLERRLGEPTAGTERVIAGDDVVLIEKGTEVILDVIKDVLTGGNTSR